RTGLPFLDVPTRREIGNILCFWRPLGVWASPMTPDRPPGRVTFLFCVTLRSRDELKNERKSLGTLNGDHRSTLHQEKTERFDQPNRANTNGERRSGSLPRRPLNVPNWNKANCINKSDLRREASGRQLCAYEGLQQEAHTHPEIHSKHSSASTGKQQTL
ncbi:hypothetical protein M407DRAFT_219406, partial [Tulasnella calospora MUT 4182]